MREKHSDMFEAYVKLAEKEGLIKLSADKKDSPELKKFKSDSYPRIGSDEISTIEALYGVKPATIPGMEYEENIAEVAHPNAVVVAPAYDKLNGLVENINERSNIIKNKLMSTAPSGSLLLLKDAQNELKMSLIRVANDMDNADEDDLMVLADDCLEDLVKESDWKSDLSNWAGQIGGDKVQRVVRDILGTGEGVAAGAASGALIDAMITSWGGPLATTGAGAGALIGGALGGIGAYIFNTSPKVKNVKENAADLLEQMKDLKKAVPEEANYFTEIENFMAQLVKASDNYISALNIVKSKTNKNEQANESEINDVSKYTKDFIELVSRFKQIRIDFDRKVKQGAFAKAISSLSLPGLANDVDDVEDSFNTLAVAIENLKSTMNGVVNKAEVESKKVEPEKVKLQNEKSTEKVPEISGNAGKPLELFDKKSLEDAMKLFQTIDIK